uniref:RNA recognition motif. (A.k.a. RRM, RBD, or RNP domain)/RNA recognition motif (A.k.a. RRM, RBD, or RNP domain), putative n=1 Tax=Theileria annulata TaxID=5874 RepID=A0A3B0MXK8_THEAN
MVKNRGKGLNLKKVKKSKISRTKLKNPTDSYKNKKRKFPKLNKQNKKGTKTKLNKEDENRIEESELVENKANSTKDSNTEGVELNKQNLSDFKGSGKISVLASNLGLVFIGNVPLTIKDKSDLVKKLKINPKIIQSVHFRSLPIDPKYARNKKIGVIKEKFSDAKDNQNAYIKLSDPKYLNELLEKNTLEVDGHHLFINTSDKDSFSKFSRKKTVFVGRLPPTATEDDLYNIFMNISPVKGKQSNEFKFSAVRIVRDPVTMKSKGFGFVEFDNRPAVTEAIKELNNKQFKGYTLNVTKCLEEIKLKDSKSNKGKRVVKNNKSNKNKKVNKSNKVIKNKKFIKNKRR